MPTLTERLLDRFLPAAVRTDAVSSTEGVSGYSGSAILNALSGLGGARDSGSAARPNLQRDYLTQDELVALMRGGLYRRIVETLPGWATKKGWTITDDTAEEDPLEKPLRDLKVVQKIRKADTLGRALGEARILLVTEDGAALDQPLAPERVRKLHRLVVLDRREFTPRRYNGDAIEGELGEPDLYWLHPRRQGVARQGEVVHASRLLRFYGDDLPPSELSWGSGDTVWGADAIGQTIWDGIRNLSQVGAGGAKLAQELSVAVFKFEAIRAQSAGDQAAAFFARAKLMHMMKSLVNGVILGVGDDYQRIPANPSGFGQISEHAMKELAALSRIPLPLLYGEAPGGLNADGESWKENWYGEVGSHQEDRYREPLETIVEILYHAEAGGPPGEWKVEFNPLRELTEQERAQLRVLHTQADSAAIADGVLSVEESRSRYTQPGGYQLELQPVDPEPPEPEEPSPELLAEAEAMVLQQQAAKQPPPGQEPPPAKAKEEPPPPATKKDATEGAVWIGVRLPEALGAGWVQAGLEVIRIVGTLSNPDDDPHVTVLYLGQVDEGRLGEILEAVREVAREHPTKALHAEKLRVFEPGEHSKGLWPVVLEVLPRWDGLHRLHAELLQRLAHLVSVRQFPSYQPHLTLGYAADLEAEARARVLELRLDGLHWTAGALEVRHGRELVEVVPLTGRGDAEDA